MFHALFFWCSFGRFPCFQYSISSMSIDRQQTSSKNYFISTDFFLRTILFFITLFIIILQHLLTLCESSSSSSIRFSQQVFSPSFGSNSWSATGLYVTCWAMVILYLHTSLLVFLDNFQIQHHPATFVIQDIISSIFFLVWMLMNVIQLSHCSKRQLAASGNGTHSNLKEPFCESIPCSIYLAPSIGSFMALFTGIGLAGKSMRDHSFESCFFRCSIAAAFRKINFYKIPRFIRDRHPNRLPNYPSDQSILSNKPISPSSDMETTNTHLF